MPQQDTIAAIASPVGACARIVIRISGSGSHAIVRGLCPEMAEARLACARIELGEMVFPATVLLYEEGASYTGEQGAELHIPGNLLLARLTLEEIYRRGARGAEAGEFTARAFFNGRLDLTEAEGVAATIAASNQRELEAARQLQGGELTGRLRPITEQLADLLARLEAGIDFSEEEIQFVTPEQLRRRCAELDRGLAELVAGSARLEQLAHEPQIVLCGRPNAGKSTLLNALAGKNRAVVSAVAGTTRDLLVAEVELAGGMVRVIDTAGLEAAPAEEGVHGEIARAMQARARSAIASADVMVLARECTDGAAEAELGRRPDLVVLTKADLCEGIAGGLAVSCRTGAGLDELRSFLNELVFSRSGGEKLALNSRHRHQIERARAEIQTVIRGEIVADELTAEHLRSALVDLGEITGLVSTEEILGKVFSAFCIGK